MVLTFKLYRYTTILLVINLKIIYTHFLKLISVIQITSFKMGSRVPYSYILSNLIIV